MRKRSPWTAYGDGHAADYEAGGKGYLVIVTDAYLNTRYRMSADRLVDRKCLIEDIEDEIAYLAQKKAGRRRPVSAARQASPTNRHRRQGCVTFTRAAYPRPNERGLI
jgi:hypothetical protein